MFIPVLRGALVGLCLLGITATAQAQETIAWAKSLPAALAEAKTAKKLVMIDFFTEW